MRTRRRKNKPQGESKTTGDAKGWGERRRPNGFTKKVAIINNRKVKEE